MSKTRKKAIEGLQSGDSFTVTRTLTEQDMKRFADISKDYNPIHFDDRFAEVKNLNGRICHGLLVASLLTEIGGQLGWLASAMSFQFKKPVYLGDTITCHFKITKIDEQERGEAEAVFINQEQTTVLQAVISGILPGSEEKRVMEQMVSEGDPTNKLSHQI
ncbi:MAG: MaoC family dehydratase [Desulfobacterales bacterium]|nr:MaoC family dehydratase [Desulfobacterales bacterium]